VIEQEWVDRQEGALAAEHSKVLAENSSEGDPLRLYPSHYTSHYRVT
jgi:hypothetical protein